ncbi:hypothetical protein [Streptomyces sp. NPDC051662]|uniref:hypothetical protein n=1 Tax=Streptomyces sp. NPDC051662 TaxID=3154750 RepID=UPI00342D5E3F
MDCGAGTGLFELLRDGCHVLLDLTGGLHGDPAGDPAHRLTVHSAPPAGRSS